jgi:hypothetical protein
LRNRVEVGGEADRPAAGVGYGHELADGIEQAGDSRIVRSELALDICQAVGQVLIRRQNGPCLDAVNTGFPRSAINRISLPILRL